MRRHHRQGNKLQTPPTTCQPPTGPTTSVAALPVFPLPLAVCSPLALSLLSAFLSRLGAASLLSPKRPSGLGQQRNHSVAAYPRPVLCCCLRSASYSRVACHTRRHPTLSSDRWRRRWFWRPRRCRPPICLIWTPERAPLRQRLPLARAAHVNSIPTRSSSRFSSIHTRTGNLDEHHYRQACMLGSVLLDRFSECVRVWSKLWRYAALSTLSDACGAGKVRGVVDRFGATAHEGWLTGWLSCARGEPCVWLAARPVG